MRKWLLTIIFILSYYVSATACRFTVREIGFSILSQDIYSLVVIDQNAKPSDKIWQSIHDKLKDSNIKLSVLNPQKDSTHPYVKKILEAGFSLPALVLIAPDGRILELNANDISGQVNKVLDSPVRKLLRNSLSGTLSAILWVDGKDHLTNSEIRKTIEKDCDRINNIIPYMPKTVKNGPLSIHIYSDEFLSEKVLLWSLGVDQLPERPIAFVLYGRGRIMGGPVVASAISEGRLYNYMSMIGADCECGLDRKWMLGEQIPLLWPPESRQELANIIGFDVDNPIIQAEMSRILAKETDTGITGEMDYGIEVIDLKTAFDVPEAEEVNNSIYSEFSLMIILMLSFALFIVIIGLFFFYRNRKE